MDSSKSFFNRRTSAKRKWQRCFLSRGLCDLEDKKKIGKYRIPVHRKISPWIPRSSSNHKHHLVTINLARRRRTLFYIFFLQIPTSKLDDEEKSTAATRNEEDDTYNEKIEKQAWKDDDSLSQKNVCLIMMTVSSIVVKNVSVKIINSTCYRRSTYSI